jgi:hypothetical protein
LQRIGCSCSLLSNCFLNSQELCFSCAGVHIMKLVTMSNMWDKNV